MAGEEPYVHEVSHCDRCHHVIEPLVSEQWWVRMPTLAEPSIAAVERGDVAFHPERYRDQYLTWMRGIKDWCISRQIWLGHAIPVSRCGNGHRFAWVEPPRTCPSCGSDRLEHDPDVLDTWFSSALWPFAIFGWPEDTGDLRRFYPTQVLVTAREIIYLWVARMIMTGLRFTGQKPFDDVIITSTIMARDGTRMSKSRGNAVDPLDIIGRYGSDAVGICELCFQGRSDEEIAACQVEVDPELESRLSNELEESTGVRGETSVAFALVAAQ